MIAIGIDIGKGKHAAAVIDDAGRQLCRPAFYNNDREGAEKLVAALAKIAPPTEARIGMEATGNYWLPFHDFLVEAGYAVCVINPIVTSASISGDVRGRKSDKGDAVAIARVLLSGDAAPRARPDDESRRLVALTRHRSFMVAQRADAKRHLQSLLDAVFPEFHALFDDMFCRFAMELLRAHPTASSLARAHRPTLAKLVRKHCRGKDADAEAERLVKTAKRSLGFGSEVSDAFGACIASAVECIGDLDKRVADIEKLIDEAESPRIAHVIAQIKGSGKLLPKVIAAEFGDVGRFERDPKSGRSSGMHKRMLAFAGCEPRIRESGKWRGRVRMSKRGSGALRTALMQIAFTISQNDDFFKSIYEKHICAHQHHKVALSYVVAELLKVVCSLWKSNRAYTVERPSIQVINTPRNNDQKNENTPLLKP